MSTQDETDSFLQQALHLSNLNDSYIERQNQEFMISDNGNDAIMNKIDLLGNKIKQITEMNDKYKSENLVWILL